MPSSEADGKVSLERFCQLQTDILCECGTIQGISIDFVINNRC